MLKQDVIINVHAPYALLQLYMHMLFTSFTLNSSLQGPPPVYSTS